MLYLTGCTQPTPQQHNGNYYDFSTFFEQEIRRLDGTKPKVTKTVQINQTQAEKKSLNSNINWKHELAVFLELDLLKPAYRGAYREQKLANKSIYTALDDKLSIRKIVANFAANGRLKSVVAYKSSTNFIYSSSDTLTYFPDSLYQIHKNQKVLFLGSNRYRIEGKF